MPSTRTISIAAASHQAFANAVVDLAEAENADAVTQAAAAASAQRLDHLRRTVSSTSASRLNDDFDLAEPVARIVMDVFDLPVEITNTRPSGEARTDREVVYVVQPKPHTETGAGPISGTLEIFVWRSAGYSSKAAEADDAAVFAALDAAGIRLEHRSPFERFIGDQDRWESIRFNVSHLWADRVPVIAAEPQLHAARSLASKVAAFATQGLPGNEHWQGVRLGSGGTGSVRKTFASAGAVGLTNHGRGVDGTTRCTVTATIVANMGGSATPGFVVHDRIARAVAAQVGDGIGWLGKVEHAEVVSTEAHYVKARFELISRTP